MGEQRVYLCIDLKTFFASVECVERGLDPFSTNLIVADPARGDGTICLAISPRMKMLGVKNRCRKYEIPKNINYIIAKPRMKKYMEYSAKIYAIYLKYVSKDDMHVYSIDEVFLDITNYLKMYNCKSIDLARRIIKDVYDTYGITATCGIGTNLYLAKIALDIMSKHSITNIGWLNEERYQKELWHHEPLTDFWQIGRGISNRLEKIGVYNMYDLAHTDEKLLYKIFGINAELLIDHAWGRESCTIADIKSYKPKTNSISTSQVLFRDYNYQEAEIILKEMVELKSLELVEKSLTTNQISLYVGYSGDLVASAGGSKKISTRTNIYSELITYFLDVYHKCVNSEIPIRRIGICFCNVSKDMPRQISLFLDENKADKETKLEKAISTIKSSQGLNSILKGMNYQASATTIERNKMVGGHNAE